MSNHLSRVLVIGNFDGVHLGHQTLLARARILAEKSQAKVTAMMLWPSPAAILSPGHAPRFIMSPPQRHKVLLAHGADEVIEVCPDRKWLSRTAEIFARETQAKYKLTGWVEGEDFRFGLKRQGDMQQLATWMSPLGCTVEAVKHYHFQDNSVSSTRIRDLIAQQGDMTSAAHCLGRYWRTDGLVVHGEKRGRKIGFPTANIVLNDCDKQSSLAPAEGVYACIAQTAKGENYRAAVSVGNKPTFSGTQQIIEAHLLDAKLDNNALYNQTLTLHWVSHVREQQSFDGLESLKTQIDRDVTSVRRIIQNTTIKTTSTTPA